MPADLNEALLLYSGTALLLVVIRILLVGVVQWLEVANIKGLQLVRHMSQEAQYNCAMHTIKVE